MMLKINKNRFGFRTLGPQRRLHLCRLDVPTGIHRQYSAYMKKFMNCGFFSDTISRCGAGVRVELRFDALCLGIRVAALAFRHPVQNPPKFSPNSAQIGPKDMAKFPQIPVKISLTSALCSPAPRALSTKIVVSFATMNSMQSMIDWSPSRPRRIAAISSCSPRSCSART